jgi:alkane 1-monooxygenase
MTSKDAKYLLAFLLPVSAYLGLHFQGIFAPGSVYLAFIVIPLMDQLFKPDPSNRNPNVESGFLRVFFDLLLVLNLPIILIIIFKFIDVLTNSDLSNGEIIGSTLNLGLVFATCGINVAHELGHRDSRIFRECARFLLLPSLYTHFTISHNYGHHKWVGSERDKVTARKNEMVFIFWIRAIIGVYTEAWQIENRRLRSQGRVTFSFRNEMLYNTVLHVLYLLVLYFFLGVQMLVLFLFAALISVLLLETIDYVEHYGIIRKRSESGMLERVSAKHSWNSNHIIGRIFLFELVRHADHHLHANKPYENLNHIDESPQLPYGYPLSIILALIPPVWFRIMNPMVEKLYK